MKLKKLYNQLKESDGMAFQVVFTEIMKRIYGSDYQGTQVYNGDKKVDGVLNGDIVFAVHAPEVYKDDNVLKKLKEDYTGFMAHKENGEWSGIKNWTFVIKSKRKGVTANVLDFISDKNGVDGISTSIWTLTDIKQMVEGWLPEEIPKKIKTEIRSKILQIKKVSNYLIEDYNENKDRFYHFSEEGNAEKRALIYSQLVLLISELEQCYYKHLGAFEELKLSDMVSELVKMSPVGITMFDLHEGYQKISKIDGEGNYLIIQICDEFVNKLK